MISMGYGPIPPVYQTGGGGPTRVGARSRLGAEDFRARFRSRTPRPRRQEKWDGLGKTICCVVALRQSYRDLIWVKFDVDLLGDLRGSELADGGQFSVDGVAFSGAAVVAMKWIAVIVAITCDAEHPLLCCSFCEGVPGANPRIEQLTDYKTAAQCNRFASEWARGKTLVTGRLWGGFCRDESGKIY